MLPEPLLDAEPELLLDLPLELPPELLPDPLLDAALELLLDVLPDPLLDAEPELLLEELPELPELLPDPLLDELLAPPPSVVSVVPELDEHPPSSDAGTRATRTMREEMFTMFGPRQIWTQDAR